MPYFYPQFLGDKHPSVDYLVSVLDGKHISAYCFAQIKTTKSGYVVRKNGKKYLNVTAKKEDLDALSVFPGPTYLFGIDEQTERVYFIAITGSQPGFSAMPTDNELTCASLHELWDEIRQYWVSHSVTFTSRFQL